MSACPQGHCPVPDMVNRQVQDVGAHAASALRQMLVPVQDARMRLCQHGALCPALFHRAHRHESQHTGRHQSIGRTTLIMNRGKLQASCAFRD